MLMNYWLHPPPPPPPPLNPRCDSSHVTGQGLQCGLHRRRRERLSSTRLTPGDAHRLPHLIPGTQISRSDPTRPARRPHGDGGDAERQPAHRGSDPAQRRPAGPDRQHLQQTPEEQDRSRAKLPHHVRVRPGPAGPRGLDPVPSARLPAEIPHHPQVLRAPSAQRDPPTPKS